MAKPSGRMMREELLSTACTLVQQVGVNSFSYGALAKELGIAAPSIHHHFRTKDDLVGAVAGRYRADFAERVACIEDPRAQDRLRTYARLFEDAAQHELMCFCGSIASDWPTVGEPARSEVRQFFNDQIDWVSTQIDAGIAAREFAAEFDSATVARLVIASLEGAMLMARTGDDAASPQVIGDELVAILLRPSSR